MHRPDTPLSFVRSSIVLLACVRSVFMYAQTFTTQGITGYVDHDPGSVTVRSCTERDDLKNEPTGNHVVWSLTNMLNVPVKVMEEQQRGAPKELATIAPQRTLELPVEIGRAYLLHDDRKQCLAAFRASFDTPQILTLREGELGKRMVLNIALRFVGSPGAGGDMALEQAEGDVEWFRNSLIVKVKGHRSRFLTVTLLDHGRDEVNGVEYWRLRSVEDGSVWSIADYGAEQNGYNAEMLTTLPGAGATNYMGIIQRSWDTFWSDPTVGVEKEAEELEPLGPPPSIPELLAAGTDMAEVTRFVQGFRTKEVTVTTGWCPGTSMGREPVTRKMDRLDSLELGGAHCWVHVEFDGSDLEYGIEGLRKAYLLRYLEPQPELPFGLRWDMDQKEARRLLKDRFVSATGIADKYEVDGWTLWLDHEGRGGRLFTIRISH